MSDLIIDESRPDLMKLYHLIAFLTPENRRVLQVIYSHKPESISHLCELIDKTISHTRTIVTKAVDLGLVQLEENGRVSRPVLAKMGLKLDFDFKRGKVDAYFYEF